MQRTVSCPYRLCCTLQHSRPRPLSSPDPPQCRLRLMEADRVVSSEGGATESADRQPARPLASQVRARGVTAAARDATLVVSPLGPARVRRSQVQKARARAPQRRRRQALVEQGRLLAPVGWKRRSPRSGRPQQAAQRCCGCVGATGAWQDAGRGRWALSSERAGRGFHQLCRSEGDGLMGALLTPSRDRWWVGEKGDCCGRRPDCARSGENICGWPVAWPCIGGWCCGSRGRAGDGER